LANARPTKKLWELGGKSGKKLGGKSGESSDNATPVAANHICHV